MKRESALALRDEILARFHKDDLGFEPGLRVQSLEVPSKPAQRLAIGVRRRSKSDYQLVVRAQAHGGRAIQRVLEETRNLSDADKPEIGFIRELSAPTREAMATSAVANVNGAREIRPIAIGFSIGHGDGGVGTIAGFLDHEGGVAVLSCNHVIALGNTAKKDDVIFQPGRGDVPRRFSHHRIGQLDDYRLLEKSGSNHIDAALAVLDANCAHEGNVVPAGFGAADELKALKQPIDAAELPMTGTVAKIGRSTGLTTAPLDAVAADVDNIWIGYPGLGNLRFDGMLEVRWAGLDKPFSRGGDSGSLIYLEGARRPLAMITGGGVVEIDGTEYGISYACPIVAILSDYQVSWLTV